MLEISADSLKIREWSVSPTEDGHTLRETYRADQIEDLFVTKANEWSPHSLLRAKNLGAVAVERQLGLFDGLLPELEECIQEKLDPLLKETLSLTAKTYRKHCRTRSTAKTIIQLIFWMLTAKFSLTAVSRGFATWNLVRRIL